MKKVAVIMNTNELGGAERSLVWQLREQQGNDFTFYLPKITESKNLEIFLRNAGFENVVYFAYPAALYSISRKKFNLRLKWIKDIFNVVFKGSELLEACHADVIYINGNKAAFLFFLVNIKMRVKQKVIWHWRDYYHSSRMVNFVWDMLKKVAPQNLSFVCNSESVKKSLKQSPWREYPVKVIYNPVGNLACNKDSLSELKTIGFVSMLTPWKGLHEIILWAHLYESELESLGIRQINIYGSNIYKTEGDHSEYALQIQALLKKFPSKLVFLQGHKAPEQIFQEIDCLIHYSLAPEPFGRVIIEAFDSGIPVISTCLGGAAELVDGHVTGIKVYPHDRHELYKAIELLVKNKSKALSLINGGRQKSKIIQENISFKMKETLHLGEVS